MAYDLLLKGGILVDGSGMPRRAADVAVSAGEIVAIGRLHGVTAKRVIDLDGRVLTPGVIDIHTHYDPQILFEPNATPSCYHGVTTVVAGNCGFSIAPTRDRDRDFQLQLFAKVEGMFPAALAEIQFDFETFEEYLEARSKGLGVNLAYYIGHSSIRRWVMGEAASERAASDEEVARMKAMVTQAMSNGAAGFSSSLSPMHNDHLQRPIPSRFGGEHELFALAMAVAEAGLGTITYVPSRIGTGLAMSDQEQMLQLSLQTGRPVITQGIGGKSKIDAPTEDGDLERFFEAVQHQGASVFNLLRIMPTERPFSLFESQRQSNFDGVPSWRRFLALTLEERVKAVGDSAVRDEMRFAVENPNKDPAMGSTMTPPKWDQVTVRRTVNAENGHFEGRTIADIAAERNVAPADAILDLAAAEGLETQFLWQSDDAGWQESVKKWLQHPNMVPGVSDGGAHLDRDDGSGWSTYYLSTWSRDRGVVSLEEAVRRMSFAPAMLCGLGNVGMVREGYRADLMVFDPDALGLKDKEVVEDFPGSSARWQQRPTGISHTIVNGELLIDDGELTGTLAGEVIKVGRVGGSQGS
jgi:N-acyl-D-amino-acid deacylase